ncbi:hypothetical protein NDU88_008841 [Pleurodeles waltl]|uniref:Uncharacterized protein n=1 Tax=Pleurodeles waltl TaxID=8319 RepID=A0AAV7PU86_PLEWA|nr:hypothetical protein NDU88_008841 [Pleurodeles waltl]
MCDRVLPLGQNTLGPKSLGPALESPRGKNEGITPALTQECADAGEDKVKMEERGGGDTVAYRREKEEKRQQEEGNEEKVEEEDLVSQKDQRAEREPWRGAESIGGRERARRAPGGTWLVQIRDHLRGHITLVLKRVGEARRGWERKRVEDQGHT